MAEKAFFIVIYIAVLFLSYIMLYNDVGVIYCHIVNNSVPLHYDNNADIGVCVREVLKQLKIRLKNKGKYRISIKQRNYSEITRMKISFLISIRR